MSLNMASTEEINISPSQDLNKLECPLQPEGPNVPGCNPERGKISPNQDVTPNCSLEQKRESRSRVEIILICVLLLLFFLLLGAVGWGTYYMTSCEKCETCDAKAVTAIEPVKYYYKHRKCWCHKVMTPYCPQEPFSFAVKCSKGCEEGTTQTCGDYHHPELPPSGQPNPTVFQPCGFNLIGYNPQTQGFKDEVDLTLSYLTHYTDQLKTSLEDISKGHHLNQRYHKDMAWRPLPGLPVPMTKVRTLTEENVLSALKEDHLDFQRYLLFLDVLKAEEMVGAAGSDIILSNLLRSKHYGFSCLCRFDILIRLKKSTVNRFVTHENLEDDITRYVQMGSNERWLLANMTLTQAYSWARNITQDYRKFYNSL